MSDGMMVGMTDGAFTSWLTLLRDLSVKSALLLLTAWALTLAMRRASAAVRHLVWLLTFAGLLLLPLLSVTLPARPVAVLPAPAAPAALPSPAALPPLVAPPAAIEAPANIVPDQRPAPPLPARILPTRALPRTMPNWPALLCCLWLLGVTLAALPLAAGWLLAARRLRRCSPVTDPATLALAAEAGHQLGLRRPISLRSGPPVSVPVTFGLVRPVILLPEGAASWPAERLRVALLHEMAHIRRGDWATQTAARLVCALFWHDPLVWPAARMLRAEAERACDDLVLSSGIPAPDYAQHLLAVAAALSGADRPLPLAVPMAGRGPLESRLRAVLIARPRRAPSRRLAALAFLTALVFLVPLAVLRPAARAARRIAPPLMPTPIILPALPKAIRHFHAPIKVTVAAPPAPSLLLVPTKPTPTGVPPMKPLTPVKAAALTALAAALTLPAAKAQLPNPPASVPAASVPAPPAPSAPLPVSVLPNVGETPISFDVDQGSVRDILAVMFKQEHLNYVIEQGVSGTVSVHMTGAAIDKALNTLVGANSQPLEWRVQDGVYHIRPRVVSEMEVPNLTDSGAVSGDPIKVSNPSVSLNLKKVLIRQALDILFTDSGANYTIAAGVSDGNDLVTVHLINVPLVQALDAVLASSAAPLTYRIQRGGIFVVTPKRASVNLFANPYRTLLMPAQNDGVREQEIATLLTERAAKLAGGATPQHPDIIRLDARIAELQRKQGLVEIGTMKRRLVGPKPDKAP